MNGAVRGRVSRWDFRQRPSNSLLSSSSRRTTEPNSSPLPHRRLGLDQDEDGQGRHQGPSLHGIQPPFTVCFPSRLRHAHAMPLANPEVPFKGGWKCKSNYTDEIRPEKETVSGSQEPDDPPDASKDGRLLRVMLLVGLRLVRL
ncbi:hypothetical protein LY78DRAFT_305422 [Colletotrichum sublineola]|nr:hypothetical protein LY78DRAFT_305422 [Colletotrichum sublineola]